MQKKNIVSDEHVYQVHIFQPTLILTISAVETNIARQKAAEALVAAALEVLRNDVVERSDGKRTSERSGAFVDAAKRSECVLDGWPSDPIAGRRALVRCAQQRSVLLIAGIRGGRK